MTKITCQNEKCNYNWDYNGEALFWTSCPRCLWRVRIYRDADDQKEIEELTKQLDELKKEKERGVGVGEQDYNIGEEEV